MAQEIALPPLVEQQRIVGRIEELAGKVEEARRLRETAVKEADRLLNATLAQLFSAGNQHWQVRNVKNVILSMDAGWSPRCETHPVQNDDDWGVLKTTSVQWCEFDPDKNKMLPSDLSPRPELTIQKGDVLVTRAGPINRVAIVAAARETYPNLMISDKLIRLRPNPAIILSEFLELAIASPSTQEYFRQRKTGLASAQTNISQKILANAQITFPSLEEQAFWVEQMNLTRAKINRLKDLQQKTQIELDYLMPSVLDKAFKGEL